MPASAFQQSRERKINILLKWATALLEYFVKGKQQTTSISQSKPDDFQTEHMVKKLITEHTFNKNGMSQLLVIPETQAAGNVGNVKVSCTKVLFFPTTSLPSYWLWKLLTP